jgi:hypothetical protein
MRPFQKKYVASLLAIIKTYCIESTAHGFKYIVSEPALIIKMVWVGYSGSFFR